MQNIDFNGDYLFNSGHLLHIFREKPSTRDPLTLRDLSVSKSIRLSPRLTQPTITTPQPRGYPI